MFDSPFPYSSAGKETHLTNALYNNRLIYKFKSSIGTKYIAYLEQYEHNLTALKFCPAKYKDDSVKRYGILLNENEASRVFATCLRILYEHHLNNLYDSFGFIASPILGSDGQSGNSNKKWRVYEAIVQEKFSPLTFEHLIFPEKNAYLLVNRNLLPDRQEFNAYASFVLDHIQEH